MEQHRAIWGVGGQSQRRGAESSSRTSEVHSTCAGTTGTFRAIDAPPPSLPRQYHPSHLATMSTPFTSHGHHPTTQPQKPTSNPGLPTSYRYKVSWVVPYARTQCRPLYAGLARGRSLPSYRYKAKLGNFRARAQSSHYPKTVVIRAKAIDTSKLSLLNKLRIITTLELGCGAMVSGNPERCQEIKGDLHVKVRPHCPHARMEMSAIDDGLLAKP
ncbi:hypothetical protein Acr_06g0009150 [Actinidia rufa]|uniref:Uncharacterized protein n=1 Tax=Actinidia rufa TaxID=165716 RepID=A0A7J0ER64_9ERIC|nr:hypothetical protein Acr_06g0009150 [Actinidia rufa]